MKEKKIRNKCFTLAEVAVVVVITSIFIISISTFMVFTIKTTINTESQKNAVLDERLTRNFISKKVRESDSVNAPTTFQLILDGGRVIKVVGEVLMFRDGADEFHIIKDVTSFYVEELPPKPPAVSSNLFYFEIEQEMPDAGAGVKISSFNFTVFARSD